MSEIKKAATILLGRDHNDEFEILLLKRNKALAFAGGIWVFPGGKIEADELAQSPDELTAAKVAAVRETMEEASLKINPDDLYFYRHWTTPAIEPKRYATYFFFAGAAKDQNEVQIDDSEIKKHLWISPKKALTKFESGKLAMFPPTLMSLKLISDCQSVSEATELMKKEEPHFILPVLYPDGKTMICMYEGDAGYKNGKPETEGPRHRLIVNVYSGKNSFEFKDCEGIRPVNGSISA